MSLVSNTKDTTITKHSTIPGMEEWDCRVEEWDCNPQSSDTKDTLPSRDDLVTQFMIKSTLNPSLKNTGRVQGECSQLHAWLSHGIASAATKMKLTQFVTLKKVRKGPCNCMFIRTLTNLAHLTFEIWKPDSCDHYVDTSDQPHAWADLLCVF